MFLTGRFVKYICVVGVLWGLSFLWGFFTYLTLVAFVVLFVLTAYNAFELYSNQGVVLARRFCQTRLSNGDDNLISIELTNGYNRKMDFEIIDELPITFQIRNFRLKTTVEANKKQTITYKIRPTRRGLYVFRNINVFANAWPGLLQRRFLFKTIEKAKVYPSFSFLHNMELMSVDNRESLYGNKQNSKRLGQSKEFENIREYVVGDDYRCINWKSTARRHMLMVNQYVEEQSQNVYCIIDKGRGMQHAFNQISLLDYSINSVLRLSYLVISHSDNAGLITFENKVDTHLPVSRKITQLHLMMEALYDENTTFNQSDYAGLYEYLKRNVKRRSLFIIYTSFDRMSAMQRQLPYLKQMAQSNVVLVVFFEDKDIKQLAREKPTTTLEYVNTVVSQKYEFEQKMIVKELNRHGIYSLLTSPENLSANVINKYLEIKTRNIL